LGKDQPFLIQDKSTVLNHITSVKEHVQLNEIKLNLENTKCMLLNASTSIDFPPLCKLDDNDKGQLEEIKLLCLILTSDLNFDKNKEHTLKKGSKRISMLKRLNNLSAQEERMIDVYIKELLSDLWLAVPILPKPNKTCFLSILNDSLD
jgi:hypothetical protein